jgi:hypothetical protein
MVLKLRSFWLQDWSDFHTGFYHETLRYESCRDAIIRSPQRQAALLRLMRFSSAATTISTPIYRIDEIQPCQSHPQPHSGLTPCISARTPLVAAEIAAYMQTPTRVTTPGLLIFELCRLVCSWRLEGHQLSGFRFGSCKSNSSK